MERFCDKCGTLVSGDGKFCPSCGAPLESAVNLEKSEPSVEPMVADKPIDNSGSTYSQTNSGYGTSQQSSNYAQMPAYPQSYNTNTNNSSNDMTIGKWLLLFLISSIPMVGLIMLFVWAFSNDGNTTRQTYCKATLLWSLIMVGVVIVLYGGMFLCIGSIVGMDEFFEYAALMI